MHDLLAQDAVRLGLPSVDRYDAVRAAGNLFVELGAVQPGYVDAMVEREQTLSSFVGEGFALPHGTDAARSLVRRPALAFLQYPDGLDWEGNDVRVCIAIAAQENEHVAVMSSLAQILLQPEAAAELRTADDPAVVLRLLTPEASTS